MKEGNGGLVDGLTDCTLMLNTVVAHRLFILLLKLHIKHEAAVCALDMINLTTNLL